jgi:DNA-binding transcriptional LysR family regulator
MELRNLRAFLAVAEERHFTRAAARLGIAQPPLSQQIKSLEREIGTQLFRRHPRGAELTQAGIAFKQYAEKSIEAVEQATLAAQRAAAGEAGSLKIGFTNSASFNRSVTSSIAQFRSDFPKLHLELIEQPTVSLLAELEARRVDVAFIRRASVEDPRIRLIRLPPERLRLALPANHRLARRHRVNLGEVATEPFVLFPRRNGPPLYDEVILACNRRGFSPTIVQEAPQFSSAITLVAAGIGIALIPESLCQIHAFGVAHADIADRLATVPLSLVMLDDAREAPAIDNFVRHVRAELAGKGPTKERQSPDRASKAGRHSNPPSR